LKPLVGLKKRAVEALFLCVGGTIYFLRQMFIRNLAHQPCMSCPLLTAFDPNHFFF
jgi:hypothetical protein